MFVLASIVSGAGSNDFQSSPLTWEDDFTAATTAV
jgi:hypothetical protein